MVDSEDQEEFEDNLLAVVGMSCRLPGAKDVDAYWRNLEQGIESIQRGDQVPDLEGQSSDPHFVKAVASLDDPGGFDAEFFDMSHRESEITDPQHRVLLECAWTALEHAGYYPPGFPGAVSVFAGTAINSYLIRNLARNPEVLDSTEPVQLNIGNSPDFLATRIAYKLNLKGPSYAVQAACATSLLAVHVACENLLNEECDMALAGGVSVNVTLMNGYRYMEGGMTSADGACRPFDADSQGTLFGNGVGLVVLRRLADALDAGDTIHALIRGSAANNDGSLKAGFTAPGVEGQRKVIVEALAAADVDAETIGYVEAHGTATPLGDPIEIQALTQAYRRHTEAIGFCRIGSAKGNFGHLDAASGIAGLIKTILALKYRAIPASLHFKAPNPNIDFESSPFRVNPTLWPWSSEKHPRRAGVSSFGVGGTNVHVILEEAPCNPAAEPGQGPWLLPLSAKSPRALETMSTDLANFLQRSPNVNVQDVAYTLQVGRGAFAYRRHVVATDSKQAEVALRGAFPASIAVDDKPKSVVFMFPGQGTQRLNMGLELYQAEAAFRREIDVCAENVKPLLGCDIRQIMYPRDEDRAEAERQLEHTRLAQPALFITCYAAARLLQARGIQPAAMVGHSIGEYVAACLAGVFSLSEALQLVVKRADLMGRLAGGGMTAVALTEEECSPLLGPELALAAVNGPERCVAAGTLPALEELERLFSDREVRFRRLNTSHAFHSAMMEPMLSELTQLIAQIGPKKPQTPYLSNLSGHWISEQEATDPDYWARHTRGTVRFHDNLSLLLENPDHVFLELGAGDSLSRLLRRHPTGRQVRPIALIGPNQGAQPFWEVLGRLWAAGVQPDWEGFYPNRPRRIPLPTYAFQRRNYWIHPAQAENRTGRSEEKTEEPVTPEQEKPQSQRHPRPNLDLPYALPDGPMEELVTSVWEAALGIDGIGARDNFFDLGGDSLAAAKTADLLKRKLNIDIPASSLYTGVTVQTLAEVIEDFMRDEPDQQTGIGELRQERKTRRQQTQNAHRNRRRQRQSTEVI